MARNLGPKCKLCRREGTKLFLKGSRCDTARCAFERRDYPPGAQTWRRRKITPYGLRLREKQKVKRYYGLLERQFRVVFHRAERAKGNTGDNLLLALERRLDNVLVALGFAASHSSARQLVRHGHIRVNGRRITTPSKAVDPGDEITTVDRPKSKALVAAGLSVAKGRSVPSWLELVAVEPLPTAKVTRPPTREDVSVPVDVQLIIELLSK